MAKKETQDVADLLAEETAKVPKLSQANYRQLMEAAELPGGGTVYMSRNARQVEKAAPGEKPPIYLTTEIGGAQQSIQLRGVGVAIARGVVSLPMICKLLSDAERLADLVDTLIARYPEDLACALLDREEFLSEHVIGEEAAEEDSDTSEAAEEDTAAEAEAEIAG